MKFYAIGGGNLTICIALKLKTAGIKSELDSLNFDLAEEDFVLVPAINKLSQLDGGGLSVDYALHPNCDEDRLKFNLSSCGYEFCESVLGAKKKCVEALVNSKAKAGRSDL